MPGCWPSCRAWPEAALLSAAADLSGLSPAAHATGVCLCVWVLVFRVSLSVFSFSRSDALRR